MKNEKETAKEPKEGWASRAKTIKTKGLSGHREHLNTRKQSPEGRTVQNRVERGGWARLQRASRVWY